MLSMAVAFAGPLVGRAAELAELLAAIGVDGNPEANAVLLGGDAGIGKTRLVAELIERPAAPVTVTLTGAWVIAVLQLETTLACAWSLSLLVVAVRVRPVTLAGLVRYR